MTTQAKYKIQNGDDKPFTFATPISDHERASNMLGYALTLDDTDTWMGTVQVWKDRLTSHELAALSYVALKAQKPEDAVTTVNAALDVECGVTS